MYTLTLSETQRLLKVGPPFHSRVFGPVCSSLTIPKIMYIGNFAYPLAVTFIKIALLFQYLRIFNATSKEALLCKCLIVFITIWGVVFAICNWVPCVPLAAFWDFSIKDARCWGLGSHQIEEFMRYFVSQAITTSALDFIVFVIPIRLYFKPKTQQRTRIALLCLFVMGLS